MEEATNADDDDAAAGATAANIVWLLSRARLASHPVTRVQAVWALKRTKGNQHESAEMLDALPDARRVVAALRDPATLGSFDVESVYPAVKSKVSTALRP